MNIQIKTDILKHPFLLKAQRGGIKMNLHPMKLMLGALENPQKAYKTIHIGGTNGKGSTAKMLSSCLIACKYKTGLFTSPHIQLFNERFQINDKNVSSETLLKTVNEIESKYNFLKQTKNLRQITFFEVCTLMAFILFKHEKVDIAVIEVGMGGKLDCTNVINSDKVIITSIGRDHRQFLGNTLTGIAGEKSGIIHENADVILGPMPDKIISTIRKDKNKALFHIYNKEHAIEVVNKEKNLLQYNSPLWLNGFQFELNLMGKYQHYNSSLVLKTLELLKGDGFIKLSPKPIAKALNSIKWKGRFDIISNKPATIFDVSHNVPAIKVLIQTLIENFPKKEVVTICGFCKDKEYFQMIKLLSSVSKKIILVPLNTQRGFSPTKAKEKFNNVIKNKLIVKESFSKAIKEYYKKDTKELILVCGSFFLLEEAYNWRAGI